jgi:hypothetical protein
MLTCLYSDSSGKEKTVKSLPLKYQMLRELQHKSEYIGQLKQAEISHSSPFKMLKRNIKIIRNSLYMQPESRELLYKEKAERYTP